MKKRDLQKGAVSVFLILILVPSIVMASIFVDLSRVPMAKAVAVSAADMSLNSLASHYDAELKDFYGMVASCQSISEFYAESEEMFEKALRSQGLEGEELQTMLGKLSAIMKGDESVNDLLLMELQVTEGNKMVDGVPGATLGESALLIKDQIVEFMKYRGPIELVLGVIDRLKKNDASKKLEDAKKDEPLVESKKQYAEDEGELLEAAFYSFKEIKRYMKMYDDNQTSYKFKEDFEQLRFFISEMEAYRDMYKEINEFMVKDLVNTQGLKKWTRPTVDLSHGSASYASFPNSKIYSRHYEEKITTKNDKGEDETEIIDHYYIDSERYTEIHDDAVEAIKKFNSASNSARQAVLDAIGTELLNATTGQGADQAYQIQWWAQTYAKIMASNDSEGNDVFDRFRDSGEAMMRAYNRMLAAEDPEYEPDPNGSTKPSKWSETKNTIKNLHSKYLKAGVRDSSDKYLYLVSKLEDISGQQANLDKINPNVVQVPLHGRSVSDTIGDIHVSLTFDISTLNEYIDVLTNIIDGQHVNGVKVEENPKPVSLMSLVGFVNDYNNSFNNWSNTANGTDTDMGKQDREEISGLKTGEVDNGQKTAKDRLIKITTGDVTELNTRLTNIRAQFIELRDTMNSLEYCGKKLVDLSTFEDVRSAVASYMNITETPPPLKNLALNNKYPEIYTSFKPTYNGDLFKLKESSSYNPNLNTEKPTLLEWMEQKYEKEDESIEETEQKLETEKDNIENRKDEGDPEKKKPKDDGSEFSTSVSKENIYGGSYTGADFPSGLDAANKFGLLGSFVDTISSFVGIITGSENLSSIRDTLFSVEYVMSMFSYHTLETEGLYKLYKDQKGKTPTISGNEHLNDSGLKETWNKDEITEVFDNQTLTNKSLCANNNVAFGAEAEYVLYGNTNAVSVANAYLDIFTIRYLLNTLSGFQYFWSGTSGTAGVINGLANFVFGATSGIIPVPVTKTVAILLLTVFETGEDLNRLKSGQPVELYKTGDDWVYSIDKEWKTEPTKGKTCENGLFYSDYLYLFLYMGFTSGSAEEMYLRVGDLIQANMRKVTSNAGYKLSNARIYFKLNAQVRVRPIMFELPVVVNNYENSPKDATGWCTFNINEVRGYS